LERKDFLSETKTFAKIYLSNTRQATKRQVDYVDKIAMRQDETETLL